MIVVNLILGVLGKLLAPLLAYYKGKTDADNEALKDTVDRLANRPRSDDDVSNRLRAWKAKLKNKR